MHTIGSRSSDSSASMLLSGLRSQLTHALQHKSRTIYLDQPYNLYLSRKQADTYLELMNRGDYAKALHQPVRDLFACRSSALIRSVRQPIALIDLGPGRPDKTYPFFEYVRDHKTCCEYFPVDVNARFLAIAANAAKHWGIVVHPINSLFEALPSNLRKCLHISQMSRIVLMGLTFMNYRPGVIIPILKNLLTRDDPAVVATQLSDSESRDELMKPYHSGTAQKFNSSILRLLGLREEHFEYFVRFRYARIEMGFRAKAKARVSRKQPLREGLELLTAISYRYTRQGFVNLLKQHFPVVEVYYEGITAVAVCRLAP